jgi:hypothetical protein
MEPRAAGSKCGLEASPNMTARGRWLRRRWTNCSVARAVPVQVGYVGALRGAGKVDCQGR